MARQVSLDTFLSSQDGSTDGVRCTIEAVPAEPTKVKLTPWVQGFGCVCQLAFLAPRDAIAHLLETEHRSECCGKDLAVVEVVFNETHQAVASVVRDQARNAQLRRGLARDPATEAISQCQSDCHVFHVQGLKACNRKAPRGSRAWNECVAIVREEHESCAASCAGSEF